MIEVELRINKYNKTYYIKGTKLLHREDGPAVEYVHGDKFWYQNNKYHRLDGPAVECVNGYKSWIQYGQYHRLDGPALEYTNGDKEWYLDGKYIYCQTQEQFEKSKEYREFKLKVFW